MTTVCISRGMSYRALTVISVVLIGCAPHRPSIGGLPAAPPKPDSYYTLPAGQIASAPLSRPAVPTMPSLATLSLADVVDLSLRNNPTTRVSWATT